MFFYSDTEPRGPGGAFKGDPTRCYLTHYANSLSLKFFATKDPDPRQRGQALRELTICERKMDYWRKRPGFEQKEALKGIQELRKQWR